METPGMRIEGKVFSLIKLQEMLSMQSINTIFGANGVGRNKDGTA